MWHAGIATNITAGSPERLSRRTGSQRITRVIRQRTHAPRRPVSGRTKVSSRRASVPVKGYSVKYCDVVIVTTTDAQIVRPYTNRHVMW